MVLVWEMSFIRNTDGQQKIMFSRTYENGRYKESHTPMADEKVIFINYVSLFPSKDIVRIKLGHQSEIVQINQYEFYYIDKTFFERAGFLGAFGVSEYNENDPFDWPELEFVAKYLFSEYYKRLRDERLITPEGAQEFIDWVNTQVAEYYQDYEAAKTEYKESQTKSAKQNLMQAFQSAAASADEAIRKGGRKSSSSMAKLKEIAPQMDEAITSSPLSEFEIKWGQLKREFEFMLLNSFGNPLTKIMSFLNGEQKAWGSEEEQNAQSLEGMTYSVLKSFVEQQKLKLRWMQIRKPEGKGFEFVHFYSFIIDSHSYLIIMNVDNYDPGTERSVGVLQGDEERVLERIAKELKEHPEWFTEKGEFKDRGISYEVESVFFRNCKKNFIN